MSGLFGILKLKCVIRCTLGAGTASGQPTHNLFLSERRGAGHISKNRKFIMCWGNDRPLEIKDCMANITPVWLPFCHIAISYLEQGKNDYLAVLSHLHGSFGGLN